MADYMKRNLIPLLKQNPVIKNNYEYFKKIISKHLASKEVWYQKNILYFRYQEKEYRAFGKNPKQEAEYLTREVEPTRDHLIIVFGMAILKYCILYYIKRVQILKVLF